MYLRWQDNGLWYYQRWDFVFSFPTVRSSQSVSSVMLSKRTTALEHLLLICRCFKLCKNLYHFSPLLLPSCSGDSMIHKDFKEFRLTKAGWHTIAQCSYPVWSENPAIGLNVTGGGGKINRTFPNKKYHLHDNLHIIFSLCHIYIKKVFFSLPMPWR